MRLIDLSHVIDDGMTAYPGLPGPRIDTHLSFSESADHYAAGTEFTIGRITMVANTGTYLDTPAHRFRTGHDLAGLPLDRCAQLPAVVVDAPATGPIDRQVLTGRELTGAADPGALPHSGAAFTAVPPAVRGMATFPVRCFAAIPGASAAPAPPRRSRPTDDGDGGARRRRRSRFRFPPLRVKTGPPPAHSFDSVARCCTTHPRLRRRASTVTRTAPRGAPMIVLLTVTGWVVIGAVAGWHSAALLYPSSVDRGPGTLLIGALGGFAGGASIRAIGIGTDDPGWLLSLFTCALGAYAATTARYGAVMLAIRNTRFHRRRDAGPADTPDLEGNLP